MTTKDNLLSSPKGNKSFVNQKSFTDNGSQFSNFNLNQSNHKCLNLSSVHSESKSNKSKNSEGHRTAALFPPDLSVGSKNLGDSGISWKNSKNNFGSKTSKNLSNYFQNETTEKEEDQKRWKNSGGNSSTKNASTLSLHIAAYENSIEASSNETGNSMPKFKDSKILAKSLSSSTKFQDNFEFPRQYEDKDSTAPEIMQYSSSQKLLEPNQTNPENQSGAVGTDVKEQALNLVSSITRTSLGRTARLGQLYDVRTEELLDLNIVTSKIPSDLIETTETPPLTCAIVKSDKFFDKYSALSSHKEFSANLLCGLISGSGSYGYLKEESTTNESVRCAWIQRKRTVEESITSITDKSMKENFHPTIGKYGTHFVSRIQYGVNTVVVMSYDSSKFASKEEAQNQLDLAVGFFSLFTAKGSTEEVDTQKADEFSDGMIFKVYTDLAPTNLKSPTNMKDAIEYIRELSGQISVTDFKGMPLEFHLTQLRFLLDNNELESVKSNLFFDIHPSLIKRMELFFDNVDEYSAKLHVLSQTTENSEEEKMTIKERLDVGDVAVAEIRETFDDLLTKIRSGIEEENSLNVRLEHYEKLLTNSKLNMLK